MSDRLKRFAMLLGYAMFSLWCLGGCAMKTPAPRHISLGQLPPPAESPGVSGVEWVRYYEAMGLSAETGRPALMIYFTRDSCRPCRMMESWTFADENVLEALQDFVPVKVHGDVELQMVRRFNVETFPMVVFVEVQEGEIDRKAGYRSPEFMVEWVEDVKANRDTLASLEREIEREPENVDLLLKQALNYLDADMVDKTLGLAERAADLDPGNPEVLALFGLCNLRLDKLEAAEAAVSAALQADPRNEAACRLQATILLGKAEASLDEGDPIRAAQLYSEALELFPENFDAHVGLGRAHLESDELDKARADFQRAASIDSASPVPHVGLGEVFEERSEDALAEEEYLQAIRLEPRYEPPYFRLMELYERDDRRDALMQMFEKALAVEPAGAHNEIAWLMATSKHADIFDPRAAVKHALKAIELEPHPWYIDTLAEAYYAQGEYDLAIAIIKEAIAKEPEDMDYYEEQLQKFRNAKAGTADRREEGE